jgi:signal peptidase I
MPPGEPAATIHESAVFGCAPLDKHPDRWGKGFMAFAASVLLPGLGQFFAGQRRRGMLWLLVCAAISLTGAVCLAHPAALPVAAVLAAIETVLMLLMLIDAFIRGRRSDRRMLGRPWLRYLVGIGFLLATAFAGPRFLLAYHLRDHYVEAFVTRSGAMSPTLMAGDKFLVHKGVDVRRYSLIVFEDPEFGPGTRIVSRIVGLPGETVEIVDGQLQIDGQSISPPPGVTGYASMLYMGIDDRSLRGKPGAGCEGNPIHLGPDEYYVLGDNTARAKDARLWEVAAEGHQLGALPGDHIIGRVTAIYWPPQRWRRFQE